MLYTITVVSPEVEDFVVELLIESDATFADLHQLIRDTCGWGPHKPSTFYICDHRWHHERAIPEKSYEDETMDEVELGDLLDDEGQRLQYVFDAAESRGLLLEVTHISYGKHIDEPHCRRSHGTPPPLQIESPEPVKAPTNATYWHSSTLQPSLTMMTSNPPTTTSSTSRRLTSKASISPRDSLSTAQLSSIIKANLAVLV